MSAIWKRAYLVRRNPGLPAEAFPARWRQHSELGGTFPEIRARHRKLNYCLVDHAAGALIGADTTYDGIGMLWLSRPDLHNAPIADRTVGCICLIASEKPARFKGLFSRLLQPLTGM